MSSLLKQLSEAAVEKFAMVRLTRDYDAYSFLNDPSNPVQDKEVRKIYKLFGFTSPMMGQVFMVDEDGFEKEFKKIVKFYKLHANVSGLDGKADQDEDSVVDENILRAAKFKKVGTTPQSHLWQAPDEKTIWSLASGREWFPTAIYIKSA